MDIEDLRNKNHGKMFEFLHYLKQTGGIISVFNFQLILINFGINYISNKHCTEFTHSDHVYNVKNWVLL